MCTYDKTDGKLKAYVNGFPDGEIAVSGDFGFPSNTNAHWFGIGADCNAAPLVDYPFNGQIVCTHLYGKALSKDEVFLLNKQFQNRKSLQKVSQVYDLITLITAKIDTASEADKETMVDLKEEGIKLCGNFGVTQTQIDQYITQVQNAI